VPKASPFLLPFRSLLSSGAAGALLQGHPGSACAVLPWAAGKGRHRDAPRTTLLPSGAAMSPLPFAPLKERLLQEATNPATSGENLAEGKLVKQEGSQGVLRNEMFCGLWERPAMTMSAQHHRVLPMRRTPGDWACGSIFNQKGSRFSQESLTSGWLCRASSTVLTGSFAMLAAPLQIAGCGWSETQRNGLRGCCLSPRA